MSKNIQIIIHFEDPSTKLNFKILKEELDWNDNIHLMSETNMQLRKKIVENAQLIKTSAWLIFPKQIKKILKFLKKVYGCQVSDSITFILKENTKKLN